MTGDNNKITGSEFFKIYRAELILLMITVTWGLSFPFIKLSIQYISPVFFIFLRFLLTIVVFMIFFHKKFRIAEFSKWKPGITLGIFLFFGFAFQNVGMKYTTATKSSFITGTSLAIIPFVQYFVTKVKPKPENITGGIIVLAGLYILSEAYVTVPNLGDILTFVCAFSFAVHVVLLNKYSTENNFYHLVFGQFLTMVVFSLIFMFLVEEIIFNELYINFSGELVSLIIYTSLISTMLSILLMTKYQRKTTPVRAGIIYSMESVFAVIFAFILLGEILNFNQFIGALVMIIGLFISEFYSYFRYRYLK